MARYLFSSMTRISNLREIDFEVGTIPRDQWATGDYVVGAVNSRPSPLTSVELSTGRQIEVMEGGLIIGAFGKRYATLEAVGDWREIGQDLQMEALGGGCVIGKLTSKSPFLPPLISMTYQGHVILNDHKVTMSDYVAEVKIKPYTLPSVLITGTSMSSGKTTSARIIINQLKAAGLRVVGAKLTGSGRYRDILGMRDAGADHIFDFVDVGLPTTVCPAEEYQVALDTLLTLIQNTGADIAVLEIGSSPLEPYNGALAIETIEEFVRYTVLCASDPYAVVGLISAHGRRPDLVTGIATNTEAGIALVKKLSDVEALNLLDREANWQMRDLLRAAFEL